MNFEIKLCLNSNMHVCSQNNEFKYQLKSCLFYFMNISIWRYMYDICDVTMKSINRGHFMKSYLGNVESKWNKIILYIYYMFEEVICVFQECYIMKYFS